jgi:dolichol kinase
VTALRRELARKAIHLSTALVPLAYAAGLPRDAVLAALAALAATAVGVELARLRSARVGARFARATGALLRDHEHRRWSGATWLFVAFTIAAVAFPRPAAVAAMWAVAVGDASAAIVGRWVGRHPLPGTAKSVEGSAACFLASALGALLVARLDVAASVVAGLAATLAEAPERPLDDNVLVALAVGGGIVLWRFAFS